MKRKGEMVRTNLESQRQCGKQNERAKLLQGFIIPHALSHTLYERIKRINGVIGAKTGRIFAESQNTDNLSI